MPSLQSSSLTLNRWEQREPGAKKSFIYSLGAHSLLVLMLTIGINWRTSSTPAGVEVELWDTQQLSQKEPEPVIEKSSTEINEKAEIVIEKKKETPKVEKPMEEKKIQPPVIVPPKPLEKEKPKLKDTHKEEPKEKPKPKIEPPKVKEKPKTDPAKEAREAKAKADAEKERTDRLTRLRAEASSDNGGSNGTVGSGVGKGGTNAPGFADKVRRFIKPKIIFNPAQVSGNPAVSVNVELAPDGRIVSSKITRSSGESDWDNAVMRALESAGSLPKDDNGTVPRQITLIFRPKD